MLSSPFLTSNILFYIDFFNISYIFIVKSLLLVSTVPLCSFVRLPFFRSFPDRCNGLSAFLACQRAHGTVCTVIVQPFVFICKDADLAVFIFHLFPCL